LPRRDDLCFSESFDLPQECSLGLVDDDDVAIRVADKNYYRSNITEFYEDEGIYPQTAIY
jgi:hypothetical protein